MTETRTIHRDIVVIGASAGGLSALVDLVRALPGDLPAAVFVVVHTSPDNPSVLPQILQRAGALPAALAVDREPIVHGRIYVAAPDHHLLIKRGHLRMTSGPKENGFRPAVDPLFRTAARTHGARVIAVVLSGGLNDGTHGLGIVTHHGGVALVQDPHEALVPSMPLSAMQAVEVHHVLPAAELGAAIDRRVREPVPAAPPARDDEVDVAEAGDSLQRHTPSGEPSMYTCPDCGGALWEASADETRMLRFACHVGHSYTAECLAALQRENLNKAMWTALRALEENASLYRRMAARSEQAGVHEQACRYHAQVEQSELRARALRAAMIHKPDRDEAPP